MKSKYVNFIGTTIPLITFIICIGNILINHTPDFIIKYNGIIIGVFVFLLLVRYVFMGERIKSLKKTYEHEMITNERTLKTTTKMYTYNAIKNIILVSSFALIITFITTTVIVCSVTLTSKFVAGIIDINKLANKN